MLTRDVMQLKNLAILKLNPTNPIQPKQVKITKTKIVMFVQTIIHYCKFTNSNKQFCVRSNREDFDQVPIGSIYSYIND